MRSYDNIDRDYSNSDTDERIEERSGVNYSKILLSVDEMEEVHADSVKFLAFFVLVIPDMVGRLRYKRFWSGRKDRRYEELVTVADEGFGLLLLQNNMKKWKAEVDACFDNNVNIPDTDFTPHAKKVNREPKAIVPPRREGWTKAGLKRFSDLCRYVQEVRKDRNMMDEFNRVVKEKIQEEKKKSGKEGNEMDEVSAGDEEDVEFDLYSGSIDLFGDDS